MSQEESKAPVAVQPAEPQKDPAVLENVKVEIKPEAKEEPQANPEEQKEEAAGDPLAGLEKELAEQYESNPAPPPKVTEAPLTGIKIFELGIKFYTFIFAIVYAIIYGIRDDENSKDSTLALSIVVVSIFAVEIILAVLMHTFKGAYEASLAFKCLGKVLPNMIHVAVWIAVQVYVFGIDLDSKDSIFQAKKYTIIAWKALWVMLVIYVAYGYVLLVLNIIYWIIAFKA